MSGLVGDPPKMIRLIDGLPIACRSLLASATTGRTRATTISPPTASIRDRRTPRRTRYSTTKDILRRTEGDSPVGEGLSLKRGGVLPGLRREEVRGDSERAADAFVTTR